MFKLRFDGLVENKNAMKRGVLYYRVPFYIPSFIEHRIVRPQLSTLPLLGTWKLGTRRQDQRRGSTPQSHVSEA